MHRVLSFGDFQLDREAGRLLRGGEPIAIRKKVWDALCLLIERRGALVSADEMLRVVWQGVPVSSQSVGNLVHELRKVLGDRTSSPRYLVTIPARGFRFVAEVHEVAAPSNADGFVGRAEELARLDAAWTRVLAGDRHLVALVGEAGVGKTRLVDRFVQSISAEGDLAPTILVGRCVAREGGGEAYLPVFDMLDGWRQAVGPDDRTLVAHLRDAAPHWSRHIAWAGGRATANALTTVEARPERMQREMASVFERAAEDRPIILVFEDVHWADRSTIDFITYLTRRPTRARILLLVTYRHGEAIAADHPSVRLRLAPWERLTFVPLDALDREQVRAWLDQMFDGAPDVVERLVEATMHRSAGVPLFVQAVARLLIDGGFVQRTADGWRLEADGDLASLAIPNEVGSILAERLRRLSPDERAILEAAAVAGEQFDSAAVAGALDRDVEAVDDELGRQSQQHSLVREVAAAPWPDGTTAGRYRFVHALYRDALYRDTPSARRARLHRGVGLTIERGFSAAPSPVVATLAEHFEAGGDHLRAAEYLERTALQMISRSAIRDASEYYRRALSRVLVLPDEPDRWAREVRVRTGFGITSAMNEGLETTAIAESYGAVARLSRKVTDPDVVFPTLRVFWLLELLRFGYPAMAELDEQLRTVAADSGSSVYRSLAASMSGTTQCLLGNLHEARRYLEESLALSADEALLPPPHAWIVDPRVESRCMLAWVAWLMGEADSSRRVLEQAERLAEQGGHSGTRGLALWFRSSLAQLDDDFATTRRCADRLHALADEADMPIWRQIAAVVRALASLMEGDPSALEVGLQSMGETEGGSSVMIARAYLLGQLALAYGRRGEAAHGIALVDMALARIAMNAARVSEADLLRIRGELLEADGHGEQAEETYRRAIDVARAQGARAFELRAATARLRLLQARAKVATAEIKSARRALQELLATVAAHGESRDVQTARSLLG